MSELTLIIGNKNYSSWSMRPWLALRQFEIPFQEQVIPLYEGDWKNAILRHSTAGKVPILKHGGNTVWDSLAILEYLAEQFPAKNFWPEDKLVRSIARSISAEMHASFPALREHLPMNLRKSAPIEKVPAAVEVDIERVCQIWRDCRSRFGVEEGEFLFGGFSAADAVYAPVVTRFMTYGIKLDVTCQRYVDAMLALPSVETWYAEARAEPWTIAMVE